MRLSGSELECVRGGKRVFANIGFAVGAGEALLLLGPNGAGKSSLLRMVAGLLRPAAGSLELAGADCDRSLAEQAHYLGHLDPLKSSLSVGENLRFWTRFLGGGRGEGPDEAARCRRAGAAARGDAPAPRRGRPDPGRNPCSARARFCPGAALGGGAAVIAHASQLARFTSPACGGGRLARFARQPGGGLSAHRHYAAPSPSLPRKRGRGAPAAVPASWRP